MLDQFYGVRALASNIGQRTGNYTAEMFHSDFPQFFDAEGNCHLPQTILEDFISQANSCIQPDKWLDGWRYAAGLFIAHNATMYLRTFPLQGTSATPAQAAMTGQVIGNIRSASLGDASVSYDDGVSSSATVEWGDLNSTTYGQLLANKAKLVGMGGTYVI